MVIILSFLRLFHFIQGNRIRNKYKQCINHYFINTLDLEEVLELYLFLD